MIKLFFLLVNSSILYKPVIDRVVLLVIDALREDFVNGSESSLHMPYLSSVIRQREGILFTSLVEPPTVTLPRLKAITMGTIPNYADVILNVIEKDASGLNEESIIGRAFSSHLKIIFYGDDTWLRLFPKSFLRAEGTSSFYVSDFTEVDNNITRHIDKELENEDWDIMILHYLGLDHIGHIHGPYSHLVPQKLTEMDLIIQKLHQGLTKWGSSTLLVVCGDHGMKDTGGHGGATHPETHVPLAFISPMLSQSNSCPRKSINEDTVINQRDLAPTLSALLGLPPPSGNLGRALPSVLGCFLPDPATLLYALHVNAWQVAGLLNSPGSSKTDGHFLYEESSKLHSEWITSEEKGIERGYIAYKDREGLSPLTERIIQLYSVSVSKMTSTFAETLIKFDFYAMFIGGLITWQAFFMLFVNGESSTKGPYSKEVPLLAISILALHIIFCATGICSNSTFCKQDPLTFVSVTIIVVIMSFNSYAIIHRVHFFTKYNMKGKWEEIIRCPLHCLFMVGGFLHAVSFASSSFIEEEHQTWQFLCVSLIVLQGVLTFYDLQVESRKNGGRTLSYSLVSKKQCNCSTADTRSKKLENSMRWKNFPSLNASLHPECDFQSADHITSQEKEMYALIGDSPPKSHFHKLQEQDLQLSSKQTGNFGEHTKVNWFKLSWTFPLLLFTHRALRDWNHTGDKWGNIPDIADWISKPENIIARSVTMAFSLVGLVFVLQKSVFISCSENILLSSLSVLCIYAYRTAVGDVSVFFTYPSSRGIAEFKLFLFSLTLLLANACYKIYKIFKKIYNMKSRGNSDITDKRQLIGGEMVKVAALAVMVQHISTIWILFCTILKRPCDVPVVVVYILSCYILTDTPAKKAMSNQSTAHVYILSLTYLWIGMVFHFHQGNSNSLASIDLQAGYVGQENYNPIVVGLLLFCHTFSMPITSLVLLFNSLITATMRSHPFNAGFFKRSLNTAGKSIALARLLPVVTYLPLITIQRHHLFIWTVFSPKLIYEATLTMATLFGLVFLPTFKLYF